MGKRLYVGNLSYNTTEDKLRELFSQAGTVESANVVTDKFSGRSRGFGFVEMATDEEASKAVELFNGKSIDEREIVVNEARPQESRGERRGGGGGGFGRGGRDRGGFGGGGRDRGGFGGGGRR